MQITIRHIIVAIAALALLVATTSADAAGLKLRGSGQVVASTAADLDGDMQGGGVSSSQAQGKFGHANISGRSDLLLWDGVSFCDFNPDTGAPRGVLIGYAGLTSIYDFGNGNQLFAVSGPDSDSALCFNVINNTSFTFDLNYEVTGGLGKFAGATGRLNVRGNGANVVDGHSGFVFEVRGEVDGLRRGKGRDKDDD